MEEGKLHYRLHDDTSLTQCSDSALLWSSL